jgi:AraC family transcriptional regulator of adaptative response/methylated-DNA-[protein]-cysteine methyltransferase
MTRVAESPDGRWKAEDLRALGITPERARRWFKEHQGMTFAAWCRAHRLAGAFRRIRAGTALEDAGLDAGFESQSGFREAFARVFGAAPGRSQSTPPPILVGWVESPVGPLLAGVRDEGVSLLEYADHRGLESQIRSLGDRCGCPLVPGPHPLLETLRAELAEYFAGARRAFTPPVAPHGTPFQLAVWDALRRIPHGQTLSYEELARTVGSPTGQRAVARANGANRIAILVPCHRVIGKDGELTGYGGGLWRKRLLLELERTGRLPGNPPP